MQTVQGSRSEHQVRVFALSTCMWCMKTKKLLEENSIEYKFENVDQLQGQEREQVLEEVKRHNPKVTFPTVVIDSKPVIGYKEDELKEALGL